MEEQPIIQNLRHRLEEVVPLEAPYIIYIDPSGACNFSCSFCPCNTVDYMNEQRHKIMEMELFVKIVEGLKSFDNKIRVVYLFGFGEPLLNKNLPMMIKILRESDVCDEIRLYTNGTNLNPNLNQQMVDAGLDLIRISINALTAKDYLTWCGCELDYSQFLNNIKDLYQRSRGRTKVAIRLANATIKDELQLKRFESMYRSISDYIFMEDIFDGWPEFDELKMPTGVMERNNWDWRNDNHRICAYSLTTMTIHSNGYVSPCCADWKFGVQYGDANVQTVKDIWNSKELRELQLIHLKQIKGRLELCDHCTMRTVDDIDSVAEQIIKNIENK